MFVCLFKFYVLLFCFYCLIICSRLWYSSLLAIFILTNFCKIFFLGGFDLSVLFKIRFTVFFFFFFLNAGKKTSTTVECYMKGQLKQTLPRIKWQWHIWGNICQGKQNEIPSLSNVILLIQGPICFICWCSH